LFIIDRNSTSNPTLLQHVDAMIYICRPGHGGPTVVANTCLQGTRSEVYPQPLQHELEAKLLAHRAYIVEKGRSCPKSASRNGGFPHDPWY